MDSPHPLEVHILLLGHPGGSLGALRGTPKPLQGAPGALGRDFGVCLEVFLEKRVAFLSVFVFNFQDTILKKPDDT